MRLRARIIAVLTLAGCAAGAFGVAMAQSGTTPATPAQPGGAGQPATPAVPAQPGDLTAGVQRPVTLSLEEMTKAGDTNVARIEMSATIVRRQLEEARASRDVVKVLCLNDKLTQLDVTLRSAKERKASLDAAINRRDTELARHEFTILGVYRQRAERLAGEANQCVGSEVGIIGDTRVTTTIDPKIPTEQPPSPDDPIIIPPAIASPNQ